MPVVFDISSDEEPNSEEGLESCDFDWIKKLLSMSDGESEDSDEVVVLREVRPESKSKSSTPAVKDVDEDDDDCVVLDGDPENRVTSANEEATESDELVIVGEKGQIACRDYPHARHLCAKFPFSSTPHERHCDQCHCYVCDSLAPCLMWGTGILSSDHCHANDKTETWKTQRKNFKLGKSAPLPATNYGTSPLVGHPQCNQIRPLGINHLSPNSMLQNQSSRSTGTRTYPSLNPIPQNQASQPTIMHAACRPSLNSSLPKQFQVSRPINIPLCSPATNLTMQHGANRGRCHELGATLARNRHQPQSIPRPLLGVRNHAIQKERGSGASSLGSHFLHSNMMSNEVGSAGGTLTGNHSVHASSGFANHVNLAQQYDKYHTATGFSNYRNYNGLNDVWLPQNLPSYPHLSSEPTSLSCVGQQHTMASETQAYSQPLPQSNDSRDFNQSCIQGNDASPSYVTCLSSNQHGNEHQIKSKNENASGNIIQSEIAYQDTFEPKSHEDCPSETARNADFPAFDSHWTENTTQSTGPQIECSQLQSSGSINKSFNVEESGPQLTGNTVHGSLFDIDNWFFDQDSVPVVMDGALPSEINNIPSPDLDSGMLSFDFENPWNGLAHA